MTPRFHSMCFLGLVRSGCFQKSMAFVVVCTEKRGTLQNEFLICGNNVAPFQMKRNRNKNNLSGKWCFRKCTDSWHGV